MPSPVGLLKRLKVFDFNYAYLDSGAPPTGASSDYTTWVFIHGMGFNGAVFEKLLPIAHVRNLRIVSVYRRGYMPSSGFQEWELVGIGRGKKFEEAEPFYRAQGTEIATFLVNFAVAEGLPFADPGGSTAGGIALIGWSVGGIHANALLAYLGELPKYTLSTLLRYLHTVLSHDVNPIALGIPIDNKEKHHVSLWLEPDDRKRLDAFFTWTTKHFVHKSVTSENPEDLEYINTSEIPSSMRELSYEDRARYTDLRAFGRAGCDGRLLLCDVTAFAELTKRALFDKTRAAMFPGVRVRFMSSGTSPGALVWALWMLRKYAENPHKAPLYGGDAEMTRDIKVINQTEGNHFVFWDDPEKAMQQYSVAINM